MIACWPFIAGTVLLVLGWAVVAVLILVEWRDYRRNDPLRDRKRVGL
jgi:hypothetical protein